MNRVDCKVENLPRKLTLGRMTEKGVKEVRIDCSDWLGAWPSLRLSLWVTPPRGEAYKPTVSRSGKEVVWLISDADTASTGHGTVEVVGETGGVRKLSSIIETIIL